MSMKFGLSGYFKIDVIKPDGSVVELAPFQKNLILDSGLDNNLSKDYCHVGTGNSTPVVTQTGLDARVAVANGPNQGGSTNSGSDPYYTSSNRLYTFSVGAFNGEALTEIGIGGSGISSLWSRSLIKDSGGVPTTITVLNDEILRVTYTVRIYPPTVDNVVTINGYECTTRAAQANATSYWYFSYYGMGSNSGNFVHYTNGGLGAITSFPTGTADGMTSGGIFTITYPAPRTVRISRYSSLSAGNFANGISAVLFRSESGFGFQVGFVPPIPKTSNDVLTLEFDISWDRA
jgi:hypothetical protein